MAREKVDWSTYYMECPDGYPEGFLRWAQGFVEDDRTITYKSSYPYKGHCWHCGAECRVVDEPYEDKRTRYWFGGEAYCSECGEKCHTTTENCATDVLSRYVNRVVYAVKDSNGAVWFRVFMIERGAADHFEDTLHETDRIYIGDGTAKRWAIMPDNFPPRAGINWLQQELGTHLVKNARGYWRAPSGMGYNQTADIGYEFYEPCLEGIVEGSTLRYSDYWTALRKYNAPLEYAVEYALTPAIEGLHKAGFYEVVRKKLEGNGGDVINWKKKRFKDQLKFPVWFMRHIDDTMEELRIANVLWEYPDLTDGERIQLKSVLRTATEFYTPIYERLRNNHISIKKLCNYLTKQDSTMNIYSDYLQDCLVLEYDMTNDNIKFPRNLEAAHQRTIEQRRGMREYKNKQEYEDMKLAFLKRVKKLKRYKFESDFLLLRPPRNVADLEYEGKILNHCVGTYARQMANGETNIFLIRRADCPKKPYYTLEYENGTVTQCRTKNNLSYETDQSVKAFVESWLDAKMKGAKL